MRLERHLGSGSTAQVFAAIHPATGRRVAAKVLRTGAIDKLGRLAVEVHLAMSLHHEFVCATLGTAVAGQSGGQVSTPQASSHLLLSPHSLSADP